MGRLRRALDDLGRDIRDHIDSETRNHIERGLTPAEARRRARLAFGNPAVIFEDVRDVWAHTRIDAARADCRYALRGLARDSGFTVIAILMLAVGLALNTTAFAILSATVLRGMPMATRGDRLAYLGKHDASGRSVPLSYADLETWRAGAHTFEGLAFVGGPGPGPTTFALGNGRPVEVTAQRVSANTFPLVGVSPVLGRHFTAADEARGALPVAIVSHTLWQARLGARPDVIGTSVRIRGVPTTIVGVMPPGFVLVFERDVWLPQESSAAAVGGVFGRLRDGVTHEEARGDLEALERRLDAARPATERGAAVTVETYSQAYGGPEARRTYVSVWIGTWLILLIVCANLGNLTLVRTLEHERELSMKAALGAGRWRMAGQVIAEHAMLAVAGGIIAWWLTGWAVRVWADTTTSRYLALDYSVDETILASLLGACVVTAVVAAAPSLVTAWRVCARTGGSPTGRTATRGAATKRVVRGLVAGQVALSFVLLSGAGVLVRSLLKIVDADTGVRDAEHLLVGSLHLAADSSDTPDARVAYFTRLETALTAIPGVLDASVTSHLPVNWAPSVRFEIEGRPVTPEMGTARLFVGTRYFSVLGVPLALGREFEDGDDMSGPPVAIVNRKFAERFMPGQPAVGWQLREAVGGEPQAWRTVVAVVSDVMQVPSGTDQTRQTFTPLVYVPFRQRPMTRAVNNAGQTFPGQNLVLRVAGSLDQVAGRIRDVVRASDPDAKLEDLATLEANAAFDRDRMDLTHAELANHALAGQALAGTALILAVLGLYAMVARSVGQRTKEIGIRMAVGARPADVRRLVVREGFWPVLPGGLAGLTTAFGVNGLLASKLVGIGPYDPTTLVGAAAVLALASWFACLVPAGRAVRVEPSVALRAD